MKKSLQSNKGGANGKCEGKSNYKRGRKCQKNPLTEKWNELCEKRTSGGSVVIVRGEEEKRGR